MSLKKIIAIVMLIGLIAIHESKSNPEEIDFYVRNIYERIVKGDADDIKLVCVVDPAILARRHDLHPGEAMRMTLICNKLKVVLAYTLELSSETPPTAKIGPLIAIQYGAKGDGSAPTGRLDATANLVPGILYIVPLVRGFTMPEDDLNIEFKSPRGKPLQEQISGTLREHQDILRVLQELGYEKIINEQNSWTTAGLGVSRAVLTWFSANLPVDPKMGAVELNESVSRDVALNVFFYRDLQNILGVWSDFLKDEKQGAIFIARVKKMLEGGLETEEGRMLSRMLAAHVASKIGEVPELGKSQ